MLAGQGQRERRWCEFVIGDQHDEPIDDGRLENVHRCDGIRDTELARDDLSAHRRDDLRDDKVRRPPRDRPFHKTSDFITASFTNEPPDCDRCIEHGNQRGLIPRHRAPHG